MCAKQSLDATKDIGGGDIDSIGKVLEHVKISRPITPTGFVREVRRHSPATPNFRNATKSNDKADLESQYPFGHRLMTKQGWSDRSGLGPDGSGIQRPIDVDVRARNLTKSPRPAGLGYEPSPNRRSLAHKNRKQKVTAWHQYAADPHIGDKTAEKVYEGHETADGAEQTKVAHTAATPASANSKTII